MASTNTDKKKSDLIDEIKKETNGWGYYKPWVQMYVAIAEMQQTAKPVKEVIDNDLRMRVNKAKSNIYRHDLTSMAFYFDSIHKSHAKYFFATHDVKKLPTKKSICLLCQCDIRTGYLRINTKDLSLTDALPLTARKYDGEYVEYYTNYYCNEHYNELKDSMPKPKESDKVIGCKYCIELKKKHRISGGEWIMWAMRDHHLTHLKDEHIEYYKYNYHYQKTKPKIRLDKTKLKELNDKCEEIKKKLNI